ncbi:PREDICTED: rab11 family-interacting protein 5, partial [Tinamus guttatus]|uniref:rab11 family-interacting protein 5 n=1 Tax=Tinamus guttatus TaxID=94827 RepID=UPI00052F0199
MSLLLSQQLRFPSPQVLGPAAHRAQPNLPHDGRSGCSSVSLRCDPQPGHQGVPQTVLADPAEIPALLGAPFGTVAPAGQILQVPAGIQLLPQDEEPLGAAGHRARAASGPPLLWHKLHSKPGKKEKERGEIEVSIQFTRHNLSASMFDLSMKEKPRSPFGKLKDKVKGKKKYDLESASAIIPSSIGALDEDDDDDFGGKKSKVKGFFLRNKLRKSSLTQSNTSLGSDSTISSASLGMAGSVPEGTPSPSRHGSLSMERSGGSFPRAQHRDEPRFIPSPPSLALQEELKVSTKAVTLSNHLGRARMEESSRAGGKPAPAAAPTGCPAEGTQGKPNEEARKEEKKDKGSLSHHGGGGSDAGGKGQGEKAGASHDASVSAAAGDKRKKPSSRFGSKEPQEPPQKPRKISVQVSSDKEDAQGLFSSTGFLHELKKIPRKTLLRYPEREPAAQSVGVPVPETTPPAQGELAAPDEDPAAPAARSEWDDTFDAFASSRLKPEARKEPTLEPLAFLDDASATERPGAPAGEDGSEAFGKASVIREVPPSLRSWAPYSGLDVGANLVSTTQEATVIEDVLSPVSAGSLGRRKSSTPAVWAPIFASGNAGEKGASTQQAAENTAREEGDSNEEELPSAGENGWMTIATETAPEPAANAFERERRAPASVPHAVRPLSPTSAPSSGPEKLRTAATSSVQPLASVSHLEKTDSKKIKDATVPDQSAKYYHLTHDELIQLLLQREKELSKKEEHIRELENYIDQLLVRIMEHSPTLLQIPLGEGET